MAQKSHIFVGFVLLSALAVLPIAAVTLPPILDYPNHLARMHILSAPDDPVLRRYYAIDWAPLPNLAADLAVPAIARVMPIETAMRLFLALILVAQASGTLALHRAAFRSWSIWPLSTFLLLYNRMLLWGFLNYLAGVALLLWGLALWVALDRKNLLIRVAAGIAMATATYIAHLAAFGCYALAVVAYSAAPRQGENFRIGDALRRSIPAIGTLMPAVILYLASPTSGAAAGIAYGNPLRKLDLPVSIVDNYNRIFDGATFGVLVVAMIAALVRGGLVMERRLCWSLVATIAAYLLLPSQFLSAAGIDHRLPVAIALVFVGASDWRARAPRRRAQIAGALLALLVVRTAIVIAVWIHADDLYRSLRPAFALVPEGGAVAVAAPSEAVRAGGVPLLHFPTLAVLDRDAFVPTLFADPAQQPVILTPLGRGLAAAAPPAALWQQIAAGAPVTLPGYDRLMIVDPPRPLDPARLPGPVIFDAPRMVLIDVSPPIRAAQGDSATDRKPAR